MRDLALGPWPLERSFRERCQVWRSPTLMDLIILVLVIALVGFLVWLLTTQIPMPPMWATAIQVIALILVILFLITRLVPIPNVLGR